MSTSVDSTAAAARRFEAAIDAAGGGDGDAYALLLGPLLPRLSAYLRAQVGDDADDLRNDVLLAVFAALPRFVGTEAQFRSWVFTVARHRVIDQWRSRKPTTPLSERDATTLRGGDVEAEAMSGLVASELRDVLDELAPAYRQVLLLRVVADLSVEETATVLGKRPGAVRVLQHRALEALRKRIARRGVTP